MRTLITSLAILMQLVLLSGCASAWQTASYGDDLYDIHNKTAIANRKKAEAELAKAEAEARQAQYEANLAQIRALAAEGKVSVAEGSLADALNSYEGVLADNYESAYARRLYGFSSPTYNMPSSYYTLRYSDAFHYASAYDPAFYNVMVSGDMIWVEPKYVTSMFGSWGAAIVPSYSWYYGWDYPWSYYSWRNPYYRNSWWYNPYNWGWGWRHPMYCHHHHHYHPHKPSHHRPIHGGVGNTGHNRHYSTGRNTAAQTPANRGGSTYRPSTTNRYQTTPSYRGGTTTQRKPSSTSSTQQRGSVSQSSSSSTQRSGGTTYRSRSSSSSSSSSSYRSPSYSSSYRSSGSSSPSYRTGSSSGGNARGR